MWHLCYMHTFCVSMYMVTLPAWKISKQNKTRRVSNSQNNDYSENISFYNNGFSLIHTLPPPRPPYQDINGRRASCKCFDFRGGEPATFLTCQVRYTNHETRFSVPQQVIYADLQYLSLLYFASLQITSEVDKLLKEWYHVPRQLISFSPTSQKNERKPCRWILKHVNMYADAFMLLNGSNHKYLLPMHQGLFLFANEQRALLSAMTAECGCTYRTHELHTV